MRKLTWAALVGLAVLHGAGGARAAGMTYELVSGTLDSLVITVMNSDGTFSQIPLDTDANVDSPVADLTGASVTVDLDGTAQLLDLTIELEDPVLLPLNGLGGWDSVTFSDAIVTTLESTELLPTGTGSYDANAVSSRAEAVVILDPVGDTGVEAGALPAGGDTFTDLVELDLAENGIIRVDVNGVVLGAVALIDDPGTSAFVTANFSFEAASRPIPEPGTALLFSLGLIVTGLGVRRRVDD